MIVVALTPGLGACGPVVPVEPVGLQLVTAGEDVVVVLPETPPPQAAASSANAATPIPVRTAGRLVTISAPPRATALVYTLGILRPGVRS